VAVRIANYKWVRKYLAAHRLPDSDLKRWITGSGNPPVSSQLVGSHPVWTIAIPLLPSPNLSRAISASASARLVVE
jgi:hypothetical protein